ncbi:hypothetical protein [Fimbriiglobus ruber]|uniref:hypothetical protein n=1 Tax=Fimbriiglobus ruber TaxID=1908690 RepID=UPI000B4B8110|nr:hypothetical protein [Fimbriiglobus ruber]
MPYTLTDYPELRARLLGDGRQWHMLRKDLLQHLDEMPAHFDQATSLDVGCAPQPVGYNDRDGRAGDDGHDGEGRRASSW